MKHPLQWAVTRLKKPGIFLALQTFAGLVSANAAGVLLSHFQTVAYVAADPIGHPGGGGILHSIPILARLSGDIEGISIIVPLAGAVIGTLLPIMLSANGNFRRAEGLRLESAP